MCRLTVVCRCMARLIVLAEVRRQCIARLRLTVLPLATRVMSAIAVWLSDYVGEEVMLRPDLDQISALSAERDAQWKRVSGADFLTDAEKRSLLGLPALEVGNGS